MKRLVLVMSMLLVAVSANAFDFADSANWIYENRVVLLAALLAISEVLALIPAIKANSIFQLVVNALVYLKDKLVK